MSKIMKYKIEKNVPLPELGNRGNEWSKWKFVQSLDNGDSFIVDIRERNSIYQYCKIKEIKTVTRLSKRNREKVRIWVYPQK